MRKRVDPELQYVLDLMPPVDLERYEETRRMLQKARKPFNEDPSVGITDRVIDGLEGRPPVRVRVYAPKEKAGPLPGLLWMHGGGYVLGAPEEDDGLCQRFVLEAECVVVSVDYRLAPEHPYPEGLEDCYTALLWLHQEAAALGVNPEAIGAAGPSAGGGLTAALALLARDRGGPKLIFQMPLYPMLDDRNNTPSSLEITENLVWSHGLNEKAWSLYLKGKNGTDEVPPYAAPARAEDLSNLPYMYTCVGQLDPFRDETLDYVARLCRAGVDVEFHLYPGCYHGFEMFASRAEISRRAAAEYVAAVRRALDRIGRG